MIDLTGPPRGWSQRLRTRFAGCQEQALHSPSWWKPPGWHGEPELLDRLAELFGNPPDRTVVNGGVRQFATSWAAQATAAVVETPTFADIPLILGSGARVRSVPWSGLADGSLAGVPPGTVWLTSPFRNPDGQSLDPALVAAAGELSRRSHTVVVNQVYRWFDGFDTVPTTPDSCWTVTSLAKVAGGGVRLGWATAPAAEAITRTLTSDGPPTAWQRGWAMFLTRRNLQALWTDCVEPTIEARQAFTRRTGELLGWSISGGGPSLLLEVAGGDEAAAMARLAGQGLRVSPGSAFGAAVATVRLAFSGTTVAEAATAADGVARLAGAGLTLRPSSPGAGSRPATTRSSGAGRGDTVRRRDTRGEVSP